MADLSLIEFGVYGSICYGTLLTLVSLISKPEIPSTRSYGAMRLIFVIPGLICAGVLMTSGVNITLDTQTVSTPNTNSTISGVPSCTSVACSTVTEKINTNSTSITTSHQIVLKNAVWITVHLMFFMVFFIYIVSQILFIFTKHD